MVVDETMLDALLAALIDDFGRQNEAVGGRTPVYERLLVVLSDVLRSRSPQSQEVLSRLAEVWREREFHVFYDRPLLLQASLRYAALALGPRFALYPALGQEEPDVSCVTADNLLRAFSPEHEPLWRALKTRRVQTNETYRAVIWRWPAQLAGCHLGARPLALYDLGTSAGLNLVADQLPACWKDETGEQLGVAEHVHTSGRYGFDQNPLDVLSVDDSLWMRACIWPGDRLRLARFEEGVLAMRKARDRGEAPALVRCDASEIPEKLSALSGQGDASTLHLAFQSYMKEYLSPETRVAYEQGMHAWLASLPTGRAAWIELEGVRAAHAGAPGGMIAAHLRGRDGRVVALCLGHCGYHPTDILVDGGGAAEFTALLGPQTFQPFAT